MFRRVMSRLFRKELDCCFGCLYKRKRRTSDKDPEGEQFYFKGVTREGSQLTVTPIEERAKQEEQRDCDRDLTLSHNLQLIDDNIVAVVEDLAAEEFMTSRILACRMARSYYGRVSPRARDELRKILNRLIVDNNLQVRRTAVTVLAYIENEDDVQSYSSYFTSALEKYAEEEKDGLREKGARLLIDVSSYPQLSEETREAIIPVLQKYSKHSSWEVRHMIANNILKVLKALKVQTFKSRLAGVLQNLLADSEPIVRTAADNQVEEYYNYLIETAEEP